MLLWQIMKTIKDAKYPIYKKIKKLPLIQEKKLQNY